MFKSVPLTCTLWIVFFFLRPPKNRVSPGFSAFTQPCGYQFIRPGSFAREALLLRDVLQGLAACKFQAPAGRGYGFFLQAQAPRLFLWGDEKLRVGNDRENKKGAVCNNCAFVIYELQLTSILAGADFIVAARKIYVCNMGKKNDSSHQYARNKNFY